MATEVTRADSTSTFPWSSPVEATSPLSRLRQCPTINPNSTNQLPRSLRKQYESTAESVKNLLISDLTSRSDASVEAMVDLANNLFTSLDFLHAEYSDLYAAVRDFISYHYQYSVAKKELERNKNDMQSHEDIIAWAEEEAAALRKADADLSNAKIRFSLLCTRIAETRELLTKLAEDKKQSRSELKELNAEYEFCIRSKAEMDEFVKQVDNNRKTFEQIKQWCDEAEAGIKQSTKGLLLFWE